MGPLLLAALRGGPYPLGDVAGFAFENCDPSVPVADAIQDVGAAVLTPEVGSMVYVETVTKYYVGRVESVTPTELVLGEAAWIDDTGRLNEFLAKGEAAGMSVEPYPDAIRIPSWMVTCVTPWRHKPFRRVV